MTFNESRSSLYSISENQMQHDLFATGSDDGFLTIWDKRRNQKPVYRKKEHETTVWQVKYHPKKSDLIFSCSNDGTLSKWDLNVSKNYSEGKFVAKDENISTTKLIKNSQQSINSFDISSQHELVFAGGENESIWYSDW